MMRRLACLTVMAAVAGLAAPPAGAAPGGTTSVVPPPPRGSTTRAAPPSSGGTGFIDFAHSEVDPFVGLAVYSGGFDAALSFDVGVNYRVPVPGLLKNLGGFAQVATSYLDRSGLNPKPADPSGMAFFGAVGADYDFFRWSGGRYTLDKTDQGFLRAQLGLSYAYFGGITDTKDGMGLLVGAMAAIKLNKSLWLNYNPQIVTDLKDFVFFNNIGLDIKF